MPRRHFKEAKEAYEVLTDKDKRAAYDRFGHAGLQGGQGWAAGSAARDAFSDIFGDVFGDIFGGGRRGGRNQVFRGADLRYELELSLEQAVAGDSVTLEIPDAGRVHALHRQGRRARARSRSPARPAAAPARCASRRASSRSSRPARAAAAPARRSTSRAATAAAAAACARTRRSSVKVPAGVDNGDRIRLAREGEAGRNGGPPGRSLRRHHACKPHPIFTREGQNLSCEVPVSFATAALGGSVDVPTLDGNVVLKVPAETQSGKPVPPARQGSTLRARRAASATCSAACRSRRR